MDVRNNTVIDYPNFVFLNRETRVLKLEKSAENCDYDEI